MYRDIAIALSLANLCFMKGWMYVYYYLSMDSQYHSQLPLNFNYYLAVILNVFLLASFLWIAITLVRRTNKQKLIKIARLAFIFTLTIPLNAFLPFSSFEDSNNFTKILVTAFFIIIIIITVRIHIKFKKHIMFLPVNIVLILFPLLLFNLFQPALTFLKLDTSEFTDKPLAEAITVKEQTSNRILLIIFDEMDQRLTFEDRPSDVTLPELDLFRSQALYANNAYPPAGETDLSLPSLITGKMVSKYKAVRPNDIMLTLSEDNQVSEWSTIPNIFSKAYEQGVNTSLIGWYHPYGRVIGSSLTSSWWCPFESYRQISFHEAMAHQIKQFIVYIPLLSHCEILTQIFEDEDNEIKQKEHIKSYIEIMNKSMIDAVNTDLGLILLHLPVPHPPGFYDSTKNDFSIMGGDYLDNLMLADRALSELRHNMEISGAWESTTVIITSDHWLRSNNWSQIDHRVPFMLKLAGQKEGLNYDQVFNTVLTHDLILALLKNELSNSVDVLKWIDNNRLNWSIPDYNSIQSKKAS